MAINKISGEMLNQDLTRSGVPIVFDGNLLYVDVVNRRIGINTTSPTTDFQVTGPTQLGNIIITGNEITHTDSNAQIKLGGISTVHISGGNANNLLFTDGTGNLAFTSMQTLFALNNVTTNDIPFRPSIVTGQSGQTYSTNALTTGNTSQAISTLDSILGNITNISGNVITTGNLFLTGGAPNYILTTNGAGNTSWANIATIITSGGFTGVGITLGSNTAGSLSSALSLPTGTSLTNSIALLNQLLGNITDSTGSTIHVTGNVLATNVNATTVYGNLIGSTTGTHTGPVIGNVTGNVTGTTATFSGNIYGNIVSTAQPYITSLGTLSSLTVSGNVSAGNISTASGTFSGNIYGNIGTASQRYITSVGTLANLSVTGAITSNTNVTAPGFTGNLTGAVLTSNQPNITSLGTLSGLSVAGTLTAGAVTANAFNGNLNGTATGTFTGNITGTTATFSNVTATSNLLSTTGTFTGNIYGNIGTPAQRYITSVGTLTNLVVAGNTTSGNVQATTFYGNTVGTTATYSGNVSVGNLTIGGTTTLTTLIVTQVEVDQGDLTAANTFSTFYGNAFGTTATYTGNITAGNVNAGRIYGSLVGPVTGDITATLVSATTGVYSGNVYTANTIVAGNTFGTLGTPVQPYVTTLGTLTNLAVAGNITASSITASANFYGDTIGTVLTPVQTHITTVGSLGNLVVNSNISTTNLNSTTMYGNLVSTFAEVTDILAGNIVVGVDDDISGYLTVTADATIYGNLAVGVDDDGPYTLAVTGNISATNDISSVTIHTSGNIKSTTNVNANHFYGNISADRVTPLYTTVTEFDSPGAIGLPHGNSFQRPQVGKGGYLRYNTDIPSIEYFDGVAWVPVTNTVRSQIITPDGVNQTYQLEQITLSAGCIVSINGTVQQPGTSYTVNEDIITFTEIPLDSDVIDVRFLGATVNINTSLADNLDIAGNLTVDGPNTNVKSISTGAFSIVEDNNRLVISCNGVKVFAIDSTGDVTIAGNISYGPIA